MAAERAQPAKKDPPKAAPAERRAGNPLGPHQAPGLALRLLATGAPAADSAATASASASFLVEDEVVAPAASQMRQGDYLRELRAAVCAAADGILAATGRSTEGCPFLDRWFDYYAQRSAADVDRALRRYAPETADAANAAATIPLVVARVRTSVLLWAATGRISGIPEGVPELPAGGEPPRRVATPGAGPVSADPAEVLSSLGEGRTLDPSVRRRMEQTFDASLDGVRIHDGEDAARVSDRIGARAFAVGGHVAFARGEFRPGTLSGDSLIAHELAHTLQPASLTEREAERQASGAAGRFAGRSVSASQSGPFALRRCSNDPGPLLVGPPHIANYIKVALDASWVGFDARAMMERLRNEDPEEVRAAVQLLKLMPHAEDVTYYRRFIGLMQQGLPRPEMGPGDPWGDAQLLLGIDPLAGPDAIPLSEAASALRDRLRMWTPDSTMRVVRGAGGAAQILSAVRSARPEDLDAALTVMRRTWDNTYANELNRFTAYFQQHSSDEQYRELIRYLHSAGLRGAFDESDPVLGVQLETEAAAAGAGVTSTLTDDQMAAVFGGRALEVAFAMLRESEAQIIRVLARTEGGGALAEDLDAEIQHTVEVLNRYTTVPIVTVPFETYAARAGAALAARGQPAPAPESLRSSYNRLRQMELYRAAARGLAVFVHQIETLRTEIRSETEWLRGPHIVVDTPLNLAGPGEAQMRLQDMNAEIEERAQALEVLEQRRDRMLAVKADIESVLPLLGGLSESQLTELGAIRSGAAFDEIRDRTLARIFGNIEQARRDLWGGAVNVWLLPQVLARTRAQLGIPDTPENDAQQRWVRVIEAHVASAHADEERVHKFLEILNAGLLIASLGLALFTGGGSVALAIGLGGEAVGLGTAVYGVADASRRTALQTTLYGTGLTDETRLSGVPPDLEFLQSAWEALGITVALAAFTLRGIARSALQGEQAAVEVEARRIARRLRAAGAAASEDELVQATMNALREQSWIGGVRGTTVYDVAGARARIVSGPAGSLEREIAERFVTGTGGVPPAIRRGATLAATTDVVEVVTGSGSTAVRRNVTRFELSVPTPSGPPARVRVTFEANPAAELPAGPHTSGGADVSGPARMHVNRGPSGWEARIRLNEQLRPTQVRFVAGHELDELAELVARNPLTEAEIAAELEASLFAPGAAPTARMTAHDVAVISELRRLDAEIATASGGPARATARTRLDAFLRESGFTSAPARNQRLAALTSAGMDPGRVAELERRSVLLAFEDAPAVGRSAAFRPENVVDDAFVRHMLEGRPNPGTFVRDGIDGCHVTDRLAAFENANPQYAFEEVASARRPVGGTTYRRYNQYLWNGTGGATPPALGAAARPGAAAFNPGHWTLSSVPKTVADDLDVMLIQGEDAFTQWRRANPTLAAAGSGSNAWGGIRAMPAGAVAPAATSQGGVQFSGFFDVILGSGTVPTTWRIVTMFPWL